MIADDSITMMSIPTQLADLLWAYAHAIRKTDNVEALDNNWADAVREEDDLKDELRAALRLYVEL